MKAALYGRVSTAEQAEKYGLASQITELRALAKAKGHTIAAGMEFADEGYSGTVLDRPALERLREAVRLRAVDIVLVHDLDRLSRTLAHQLLLLDEFEKAGVQVQFLATPREDTPEGAMLLHMKGVFSEYERAKLLERTARGQRERARRGLTVGGPVPYALQLDPATGKLVVGDEGYASTVRMIFQWLVEEQRSLHSITAELNRLGVLSPRGTKWRRARVHAILTSPVYAGEAHYNTRRTVRGPEGQRRLRPRPRTEWITIPVEPIIPRALFDLAQEQLGRNRARLGGRPSNRFYLLRGLLRCQCGRRLVGTTARGGHRRYRCTGAIDAGCRARTVGADAVERTVWGAVTAALRDPGLLAAKVGEIKLGGREARLRDEADHLRRELRRLARQRELFLELYAMGGASATAAQPRLEAIAGQEVRLRERLAAAEARAGQAAADAGRRDAVRRACREIIRGLGRLDRKGRRRLLSHLVDEVVVLPRGLEIHGVIPGPAAELSGTPRRAARA